MVVDPEALDRVDVGDVPPGLEPVVGVDALEHRAQLAVPLRRHLDPHLRGRLGRREAHFALGLLGDRLVDALAELLVELRHGARAYSFRPQAVTIEGNADDEPGPRLRPARSRRCAEILGAKWTAVLVHDLSEGARRFSELEHSCVGISPRTLSERLRALEQEEILVRRSYAESPPRVEYELTEKGEALLPIIERCAASGTRWLAGRAAPSSGVLVARGRRRGGAE